MTDIVKTTGWTLALTLVKTPNTYPDCMIHLPAPHRSISSRPPDTGRVSRFGLAVTWRARLICGRTTVQVRFGSPFSSIGVICGQCFVTLTVYQILEWFPLAVLTQTHSGGDSGALGIVPPTPSSPPPPPPPPPSPPGSFGPCQCLSGDNSAMNKADNKYWPVRRDGCSHDTDTAPWAGEHWHSRCPSTRAHLLSLQLPAHTAAIDTLQALTV